MTDRDDFELLLDRFFGEGPNEIDDAVIEAGLLTIETTAQRRTGFGPRRFTQMSSFARAAIAAAAVVVVALIGIQLLPRNPSTLGSSPSPGPSATVGPTGQASAAPAASASVAAPGVAYPVGLVAAGTYHTTAFTRPVVTMTVPTGWTRKADDREVFALSRGELVLAFVHGAEVVAGPSSSPVTLGRSDGFAAYPPDATGPEPTVEARRNGPTLYIDEGLRPYDTRIGSLTWMWSVTVDGLPLTIKFNGPPVEARAALGEVEAMLATLGMAP